MMRWTKHGKTWQTPFALCVEASNLMGRFLMSGGTPNAKQKARINAHSAEPLGLGHPRNIWGTI